MSFRLARTACESAQEVSPEATAARWTRNPARETDAGATAWVSEGSQVRHKSISAETGDSSPHGLQRRSVHLPAFEAPSNQPLSDQPPHHLSQDRMKPH